MILSFGSLANSTPYLGGVLLVIVLAWLSAAKSLDSQFSTLRREEELEKEMERAAAVKIPVVAKDEDGNGSLASVPLLNPTTGGDSSTLNWTWTQLLTTFKAQTSLNCKEEGGVSSRDVLAQTIRCRSLSNEFDSHFLFSSFLNCYFCPIDKWFSSFNEKNKRNDFLVSYLVVH